MKILLDCGWSESLFDRLLYFYREKARIEKAHPEYTVLDITRDYSRVMVEGNGMRGWVEKSFFKGDSHE